MGNPTASPPPASTWRRTALRGAAAVLGSYLGVLLLLVLLENLLVFHPTPAARHWQPPPRGGAEDVELVSADGTRLHAWWFPRPGSDKALLYAHGNAGNLSHRGATMAHLRDTLGVHVLIFDYPGYGKSEGKPTEAGCYLAADAAYDWLVREKQIEPKNILLHGESLGGGVVVNLAGRKEHAALILEKTYTNLPDVACGLYPWVPVRWLMSNRFDSVGTIPTCCKPVFVAHGTNDTLIPYALGRRLFEAAKEPKHFFPMQGADHNDPLPGEFFTELKSFLTKTGVL